MSRLQFAQSSCDVFSAWDDRSRSDHCAVKNDTPRVKGRFDGTTSISAVFLTAPGSRLTRKRPQRAKNRFRKTDFSHHLPSPSRCFSSARSHAHSRSPHAETSARGMSHKASKRNTPPTAHQNSGEGYHTGRGQSRPSRLRRC